VELLPRVRVCAPRVVVPERVKRARLPDVDAPHAPVADAGHRVLHGGARVVRPAANNVQKGA